MEAWADAEAEALSRILLGAKPKTTRVSDPRIEQVTPLWFDSVDFLLPSSQSPHADHAASAFFHFSHIAIAVDKSRAIFAYE